jgi:hypothetical protein
MLPLLLAGVVYLFLLAGAIVFLACLPLPLTRRYALSAALWCALWGPCTIALMLLAGAGLIVTAFITQTGKSQTIHAPDLLATFGWTYLIVGILITTTVATVSAIVHQAIIGRTTLALFRIYAAIISAGIGSIFGCALGWWMMTEVLTGYIWLIIWLICMFFLIVGFGTAAYRLARSLRGTHSQQLNWITAEEFSGQ